jgi:hypothetical protein
MKDDRRYYFALYFATAHLTAYIAILVLLITIGLLISTSSVPIPVMTCARTTATIIAFIALMCADIFCIVRMIQLGDTIIGSLPDKDIPGLLLIKHPFNHLLSIGATFSFTLWDILLVLKVI